MKFYSYLALTGLIFVLLTSIGACKAAQNAPQVPETSPSPAPEPVEEPPATTTQETAPDTVTPITPTSPKAPPLPEEPPPPAEEPTVISEDFWETFRSRFGFMPAQWDFEAAREAGGAYDRPFFELFQWGMIEKEPGFFDFYKTDSHVQQAQVHGLHILANIQPFAHWDQAQCHPDLIPPDQPGEPRFFTTKGKPCDMEGYRYFVQKLVERYDGDGVDDMPGLTFPIKHWEVMNEPEFSTGTPIFFQGDAADYFEILKATHEAVKCADPEAYVVQGGMAGMMEIDIDFWQGVFDLGGADYLDIMNMHSIGHGEHLNIPAFKQFLDSNRIQNKPVWVTEVQYQQSHETQDYNNEDFAEILARSYIFALANGIDKLFYVNIKMPPFYDAGIPFDERSALINDNGDKSALFQAHLTVANILGELGEGDSVEIIRESVGSWHIEEGQYKFTIGGRTVYALWGSGPLPAEISGEVRVIDITGAESVADAELLRLSDSPIFVLPD